LTEAMSVSYESVLIHFRKMNDFVQSLKGIPERWWLMPIAEGKWSPGEIIAHLIEWDRFLPKAAEPAPARQDGAPRLGRGGRMKRTGRPMGSGRGLPGGSAGRLPSHPHAFAQAPGIGSRNRPGRPLLHREPLPDTDGLSKRVGRPR